MTRSPPKSVREKRSTFATTIPSASPSWTMESAPWSPTRSTEPPLTESVSSTEWTIVEPVSLAKRAFASRCSSGLMNASPLRPLRCETRTTSTRRSPASDGAPILREDLRGLMTCSSVRLPRRCARASARGRLPLPRGFPPPTRAPPLQAPPRKGYRSSLPSRQEARGPRRVARASTWARSCVLTSEHHADVVGHLRKRLAASFKDRKRIAPRLHVHRSDLVRRARVRERLHRAEGVVSLRGHR